MRKFHGLIKALMIALILAGMCCPMCTSAEKDGLFEGMGTMDNPYRIHTAEDLMLLRDTVNKVGITYEECYFLQTDNLDFSEIANWKPIGLPDSDRYFCGVYNGGGCYIENLSVKSDQIAGLFGVLGGTVINLGIESGNIEGAYAGAIAGSSMGAGAKVINCYNKADVHGLRAGGIVDNFYGTVANCWNTGKLTGSEAVGGIAGCSADRIYNCYSAGAFPINENFMGVLVESDKKAYREINTEKFCEIMNAGIFASAEYPPLGYSQFKTWAVIDDVCTFSSDRPEIETDVFRGEGTKENPYIIDSYEELVKLRTMVNSGAPYRSSHFKQTEDIIIPDGVNWIPIGIFASGKYFYGIYDGAGHSIENLVLDGGNAGFFGQLGGTVKNLGIGSGSISGNCVGSFASHAVDGNAQIINCYSRASLSGARAGGIADNFSGGKVINCFFDGELEGDETGGIVSFDASSLRRCYSPMACMNENFTGSYESVFEITYDLNSEEFVYLLNYYIISKYKLFHNTAELKYWKLEDGLCVLEETPALPSKWYTMAVKSWIPYFIILFILAVLSSSLIMLQVREFKGLKKKSGA